MNTLSLIGTILYYILAHSNQLSSCGQHHEGLMAVLTRAVEKNPLPFLESVSDSLGDLDEIGLAAGFRSWAHVFFLLRTLLPKACFPDRF